MGSLQNATLPDSVVSVLDAAIDTLNKVYTQIPGSAILWRYIKSSHQNDPFRSVLELLLVFFVIRTWRQSRTRDDASRKGYVKLSESEVDDLVAEWNPEPLLVPSHRSQDTSLPAPPIISGPASLRPRVFLPKTTSSPLVVLPGDEVERQSETRECINLASADWAGLSGAERITEKAIECLKGYGVGSCGPPGFYGTFDVHMQLESDLARFLGTQSSIIYAQSFSTISSVIPCFSKRGDIIVADRGCNFSIQKGIQISRSTVRWYDHNDVASLERTLAAVEEERRRTGRKLTRRFIITEGVFENDGMIVNLPKVVELAKKWKYRLVLDETWSFGSMGRTGRGLTEVFDIPAKDIDFLIGSMAVGLCSSGGFCAGSKEAVFHQRINSAALVYSAALPPLLAAASSEAITALSTPVSSGTGAVAKLPLSTLSSNVRIFRTILDTLDSPSSPLLFIPSHPSSPLIHLTLRRPSSALLSVPSPSPSKRQGQGQGQPVAKERDEEWLTEQERLLQSVVDHCLEAGVLITRSKKVWEQEMGNPVPSLRICISAALEEKEVTRAAEVVRDAVVKVVGRS